MHEHYEELCALLPIGQLSAEEYAELMAHLRSCAKCRRMTDEFSIILDKMPVGKADVDENNFAALQSESYRARFLRRAMAEGVLFSNQVLQPQMFVGNGPRRLRFASMLSFAGIAAVALIIVSSTRVEKLFKRHVAPTSQPQVVAEVSTGLSGNVHNEQLISQLQSKLQDVDNDAARQKAFISDLMAKLGELRAESNVAQQHLAETANRLVQSQQQTAEMQHSLNLTRAELDRVRSERDNLDAVLADQASTINDLRVEVREKEAIVQREHQLDSVADDVRELMGARSLHILDVSDVDGNGRSKKSFGRVFLVEGKMLIFYAFDLGDRGNPAKVSFQAWGQLEGRGTVAKNLGVFYIDDREQRRWILKVNDPKKLSAINSLFVTVEPPGGADRPTGKKLLYAFLGTEANHP